MDSEDLKKLGELGTRFRAPLWHTDEALVVKTEKGAVLAWANSKLCGEYLEAACPARVAEILQRLGEAEAEAEAARKKAAELRAKVNGLADIALFFETGLEYRRSPMSLGPGPFEEARRILGKEKRGKLICSLLDDLEELLKKRREKLRAGLTCSEAGTAEGQAADQAAWTGQGGRAARKRGRK